MSKEEDLSREYVLPFLDKHYEKYGEHKQMKLSRFDGYDMMSAYEEGYHQAEKGNKLTWEDIVEINKLLIDLGMMFPVKSTPDYYDEVLKRFKNFKERKQQ